MITSLLLLAQNQPVSRCFSLGGFVVLAAYLFFVVLIIVGLVRLVRFLGGAGREIKLTRIELAKLADEVQQLREKLEPGEPTDRKVSSD